MERYGEYTVSIKLASFPEMIRGGVLKKPTSTLVGNSIFMVSGGLYEFLTRKGIPFYEIRTTISSPFIKIEQNLSKRFVIPLY